MDLRQCNIKSRTLLSIGNYNEQLIPVVLAIENNPNAIDMVHYLYDETLKEDLMSRKDVNGATFITQCIYAKAFGVKELVNKMSEENLKMKNNCGSTVLGICAQVGNIEMTKCIIGKSRTLLSIGNYNEQLIPVLLAIENNPNAIDMVHYLYDETLKEDLMSRKDVNGATFITQCIYAKAFGVKELVNKMSEENLKTKNNCGFTVLGICAQIGNIEMTKCIIGKSRTLLSIGNYNEQLIPVVLAIKNNSNAIDMVHYLFDETLKKDLMSRKDVNGATFISQCIYAKAFDLALDLFRRYPALALALDANKQAPLLALASVSFAYPSGNQFIFWKQWIYDSVI
ncbi:ankyrin repeat-containing protein npr4 [Fagus crenata]